MQTGFMSPTKMVKALPKCSLSAVEIRSQDEGMSLVHTMDRAFPGPLTGVRLEHLLGFAQNEFNG